MNRFFNIGDRLYGFCNGFFGRDDYGDKICIMVSHKYAVFQYLDGTMDGYATVLNEDDSLTKEMVDKWKVEQCEEEY